MSFAGSLNNQYSFLQSAELLMRIVVACLCGAAFGFERSRRLKEAGVRTHLIVCATAALLMIVSKYAFADLEVGNYGVRGADDARIAAQVVSGISFLCAGVIIKVGGNIHGLTTAAGLWMTAAVGLALGAGLYFVGIFMVLIMIGSQFILHRVSYGNEGWSNSLLTVKAAPSISVKQELDSFLERMDGQSELLHVLYGKEANEYQFHVRTKKMLYEEQWQDFFNAHDKILEIDYTARI